MPRISSTLNLSDDEFVQVLTSYHNQPRLWCRNQSDYVHNGSTRFELYETMLSQLSMTPVANVADLQAVMRYIRSTYRYSLKQFLKTDRQPKWKYFNFVDSFLREFITLRATENNDDSDRVPSDTSDQSISVYIAKQLVQDASESSSVANIPQTVSPTSNDQHSPDDGIVYEIDQQQANGLNRTEKFLAYLQTVLETLPEEHRIELMNFIHSALHN